MTVEMAIWRMTSEGPQPLKFSALDLESRLEDMIVADPSLTGMELLVVGRQVPTDYGGFIDVLAVDSDARLHVLELKRDRTPRDRPGEVTRTGTEATSQPLGGSRSADRGGSAMSAAGVLGRLI